MKNQQFRIFPKPIGKHLIKKIICKFQSFLFFIKTQLLFGSLLQDYDLRT